MLVPSQCYELWTKVHIGRAQLDISGSWKLGLYPTYLYQDKNGLSLVSHEAETSQIISE